MRGETVSQARASSAEAHQYVQLNHPWRRRYRVLAVVAGLVLAAAGAGALVVAGDVPFAGRAGHGLAGLTLNRAGGVFLLALAALVIVAAVLPGNAGAVAMTGLGGLILLLGLVVLGTNRTPANILAFSVVDVCALWVLALVVFWCGMHTWESDDGHHRPILGDQATEYRTAARQ